MDERDRLTVEADLRYEGYLKREARTVAETIRLEGTPLPPTFDYHAVAGLSAEVRHRLSSIRPDTLGQAGRVPGVTPAAVALLARLLVRHASASRNSGPAETN
jgi:tRNA uridine 5-carboxymethylaminomethyl modification enzyme